MRWLRSVCAAAAFCLWWAGGLALAAEPGLAAEPMPAAAPYVLTQPVSAADFALVGDKQQAQILLDAKDHKGLLRAAATLQQDIHKVTGRQLPVFHSVTAGSATDRALIIGSLDQSALLADLVQRGKLDVSAIQGRWEAFQISLVDAPLPGVKQALVIAGSDKRGAIFGVYDLAEQIGVSPWVWWADVPVQTSKALYIKAGTLKVDAPKVKYRGIFLNDEYPALTSWVTQKYGGYNHKFYQQVFELLLRLKANFLWPAMWNNAFADDDPQNAILADEMGIVMSNSHHEPMLRADKEWNRYGKGPWEYSKNREAIYQFWQQGAARHQNLESIFTLGMRGQEDEPMSEGENIGLLERIVADQRQILSETFKNRDIKTVPQVWALYKEVQGFYERGMRVPDDVTLLWSDDNFGHLRRLPTADERSRIGGAGVYYHFDYVGGPRSYTWINSTPIAKIWQQMDLAWRYQANRIWIVNVGDLKPMEYPIDFFLRMAWNPTQFTAGNLERYARDFAAQQFGPEHAEEISYLLEGYSRHNGRRRPEAMTAQSYPLLANNEAARVSRELADLSARSTALLAKIPANQRDAFIQLVDHPVQATQALFELYHATARNQLWAAQGRRQTNAAAADVKRWFMRDAALTTRYHQLGTAPGQSGRWDQMMAQPHIGLSYWRNPEANTMPAVLTNQPITPADMGVVAEGSAASWPQSDDLGQSLVLPRFDRLGTQQRVIEIFNRGSQPFLFTAKVVGAGKAAADWLQISAQQDEVAESYPLRVSIDWRKTQPGINQAEVWVKGTGYGWAKVKVTALDSAAAREPVLKAAIDSADAAPFADADGYISVNASSALISGNTALRYWQQVAGLGRFLLAEQAGSMVAVTPADVLVDPSPADISPAAMQQAPQLQFPLYFQQAGEFELQIYLSPALQITPGRGVRLAVALDDAAPQLLDLMTGFDDNLWQQAVLDNIRILQHRLQVGSPGLHQLRVYLVDPAVVLQKVMINTGALQPGYLGPVQSRRLQP
ncbi:MAG: glycosyl hydrolase 115 family protein [Rheinheimera sp.]|nr:glycosyl hydrolase 115 family protein [Rheinheimera sp.]